MRIEVTTEGNRLILPRGFRLRSPQTRLMVEIPDEAIERPERANPAEPRAASSTERVSRLLSDIHGILGEGYRYVASGKTDRELLAEALLEKYGR